MQQTSRYCFDQVGHHTDLMVPVTMITRCFTITGQPYVITATYSDQAYHTPNWVVSVSHAHGLGQQVAQIEPDQIQGLYADQVPQWALNMARVIDRTL